MVERVGQPEQAQPRQAGRCQHRRGAFDRLPEELEAGAAGVHLELELDVAAVVPVHADQAGDDEQRHQHLQGAQCPR